MMDETQQPGRAIADLLPWYATGRLTGPERQRVALALATDAALQREFATILEEKSAVVESNETLGVPSREAVDRLFAAINAEGSARNQRFDLMAWVAARLETRQSRMMAWGAMAAAALVVAQAGIIGVLLSERPTGYVVSSVNPNARALSGGLVLVSFDPNATAGAIQRLLEDNGASIVEGPLAGGIYELRIGDRALTKSEADEMIARLKAQKNLIRFVAPGTPPD